MYDAAREYPRGVFIQLPFSLRALIRASMSDLLIISPSVLFPGVC